jgi:hypothetical protein
VAHGYYWIRGVPMLEEVVRFLGLDRSAEGSETHVLVDRLLRKREKYEALGTSIAEIEAELKKRGISVDPPQQQLF